MTEYDFSPQAYERYMDNQNRVSNWVHKQADYTPQYSSPFKPRSDDAYDDDDAQPVSSRYPSPPPRRERWRDDENYYERDRDRSDRGSSRRSHSTSSRPHMHRSISSPHRPSSPSGAYQYPKHSRSSSRSRDYSHSGGGSHSRHHHESRSHRHHNQPATPIYYVPPTPTAQPNGYFGHPQVPVTAGYQNYTYDPSTGREIVLPPIQTGQGYMICPPGHRIEVVYGSSNSGSRSSSQSPTKKNNPPLLKRLFGLGSRSGSGDSHHSQGNRLVRAERSTERRLSY